MKRRQKILVTDIDDTMIKQYQQPTEEVKELWRKLNELEDLILVVATGQQYMKVKEIFLSHELALPHYVLADQGSLIFDTRKDQILKRFFLKNADVKKVADKFFEMGGKKEFVRIYTGTNVVAYECFEAHDFFKKTSQRNVLFGENIYYVIDKGRYSKVIMMEKKEFVDRLVLFAKSNTTMLPVNTGVTSYGNCDFHRFEVTNSDKKTALAYLLATEFDFPENKERDFDFEMLALGDEQSDYGLAQIALSLNMYPESTGHFALIQSMSDGNKELKKNVLELGTDLGVSENILLSNSVIENGWVMAVEKWLEKVK